MPSFNVDYNFSDHPKVLRLIGRLGNGADAMLVRLWNFCAKFFGDDGFIRGYSAAELEASLRWWGEPGKCVEALLALGFIHEDETGIQVHDWSDNQPHIKAYRAKAKMMNEKKLAKVTGRDGKDLVENAGSHAGSDKGSPLPASPNAMQCNAMQGNAMQINAKPSAMELGKQSAVRRLGATYRECVTTKHRVDKAAWGEMLAVWDEHPTMTEADFDRIIRNYGAACRRSKNDFQLACATFFRDGEWENHLEATGADPPSKTTEDLIKERLGWTNATTRATNGGERKNETDATGSGGGKISP